MCETSSSLRCSCHVRLSLPGSINVHFRLLDNHIFLPMSCRLATPVSRRLRLLYSQSTRIKKQKNKKNYRGNNRRNPQKALPNRFSRSTNLVLKWPHRFFLFILAVKSRCPSFQGAGCFVARIKSECPAAENVVHAPMRVATKDLVHTSVLAGP